MLTSSGVSTDLRQVAMELLHLLYPLYLLQLHCYPTGILTQSPVAPSTSARWRRSSSAASPSPASLAGSCATSNWTRSSGPSRGSGASRH